MNFAPYRKFFDMNKSFRRKTHYITSRGSQMLTEDFNGALLHASWAFFQPSDFTPAQRACFITQTTARRDA